MLRPVSGASSSAVPGAGGGSGAAPAAASTAGWGPPYCCGSWGLLLAIVGAPRRYMGDRAPSRAAPCARAALFSVLGAEGCQMCSEAGAPVRKRLPQPVAPLRRHPPLRECARVPINLTKVQARWISRLRDE